MLKLEFTAQALELPFALPFLQPNASFTKGANFASSGSGLLDSTNAGEVSSLLLLQILSLPVLGFDHTLIIRILN